MFSILGTILDFLKAIPQWIQDYQSAKDRNIGKQLQQDADLAATQKITDDQKQAAANAPLTIKELEDKLNKGQG